MLLDDPINKKVIKDSIAVVALLIIMWSILTLVIFNIMGLVDSDILRTLIAAAGLLVGTFATASSVAVINHLRKNKKNLYPEESNETRSN